MRQNGIVGFNYLLEFAAYLKSMKKLLSLFLLLLISIAGNSQTKKVLFVGNSYTYVNNLPQTLADLALSLGDSVQFDSSAPGGYTFQLHTTNATTLAKIALAPWDYVVLQEQSQLPSFDPTQVATDVYPYARQLDSLILANDSCTETLFYMTWGRQNGDASNCPFYTPVCTYNGMQQRLRESYVEMAQNNHASVSPVGVAWKRVRDNYPGINLYMADESHPSIYGTYLAACTFYSSIFHKSSVGASFVTAGISLAEAHILQSVASSTVLDSISLWQGAGDIPTALIASEVFADSVSFSSNAFNETAVLWNFGDGATSALLNPSHVYAADGMYIVALTASNACKSIQTIDTVFVTTTSVSELLIPNVNVFPNPANSYVDIRTEGTPCIWKLEDVNGKLLKYNKQLSSEPQRIDVSQLKSGIYFLHVISGGLQSNHKLVITRD